jgi:hypothetical protein
MKRMERGKNDMILYFLFLIPFVKRYILDYYLLEIWLRIEVD